MTSDDSTARGTGPRPKMAVALTALAIALVCFQLYTAGFGQFPPLIQRSVHVGLGMLLLCLGYAATARTEHRPLAVVIWFAAGLIAAGIGGNMILNETRLTESFGLTANTAEIAMVIALILIVLETARRSTGYGLPIIAVAAIAYTLLGNLIPGSWGHFGFSFSYFVEFLFLGTEGVWGTVTGLSANLIAIFIIFGATLLATGAAQSFMDIALLAAGRFPGGVAKVAIFSSSLFGMLNGAAVANVATTGNFTIPMMKRLGYRPAFAGAVEATASSGGQITPPIMGAGAFVMAELLGVPYLDIVRAAILPALLFYVCIWFSVDIEARRDDMKPVSPEQLPKSRDVFHPMRIGPLFMTLAVTLGTMFAGATPTRAAFLGIVTNLVLYAVFSPWSGQSIRERLAALADGALAAARSIVSILALLLCAQIALSLIGLTGVGVKLSEAIVSADQSGGLFMGACLAFVVAIVMGMGMPTTAAYLLASAVTAPALIRLGLDPLVAHFFVFYAALLSALTPPVCTAVFAAAAIAGERWWPICVTSIRLAVMKYLLPFYFIFRQAILLEAPGWDILRTLVMGAIAAFLLAVGVSRYFRAPLPLPLALGVTLSGVMITSGWIVADLIGLACFAALLFQKTPHVATDGAPPSTQRGKA